MVDRDKPKILIVDDLPENLQAMQRILRKVDAQVLEANCGDDALAMMLEQNFALVLLDVQMPEMSGYEVAEAMQDVKRTREIPVIFVTANAAEEMAKLKGYESGAVDYLTKPFNKNVLISKVNIFLRLYKALDAARESSKAKSSFLANMSHEIRTPLNGIIGVTELLLRTGLTDQQEKYANTIYGSGRVLHTLINDILDFSKIEAREVKICPEPTHLLDEIKGLMEILLPRAVENNNEFALRYESDVCHVIADINRIKQILINLAGNALKFSKDSFVVLSIIKKGETDDGVTLLFEVKDGGIGIAPDKLDAIFDRFIQADDTTTKRFGGTGLGLAICKSLVELMGGKIGVESRLGEGATFWFEVTFPKCQTVDAEGDGFPVAPESLRQKRILIVDDFQVNCDILAGFLQHWNIKHRALTSSKEALTELEAAHECGAPYDIVISDYMMPDMNGEQLAKTILADPRFSLVKLIMITGIHKISDVTNALNIGFQCCLLKPVYPPELLGALITTSAGHDDKDSLPIISEKEAPSQREASQNFDADVLLVDDSRINQMLGEEILKAFGCRVDIAEHGKMATEMHRARNYDLIFMDCMMPEMDGYEATRHIREFEDASRRVPIVAMTANAMDGDREKCLGAGMDDYIAKPARTKDFEAALFRFLKAA